MHFNDDIFAFQCTFLFYLYNVCICVSVRPTVRCHKSKIFDIYVYTYIMILRFIKWSYPYSCHFSINGTTNVTKTVSPTVQCTSVVPNPWVFGLFIWVMTHEPISKNIYIYYSLYYLFINNI